MVLLISALLARKEGRSTAFISFGVAALVYFFGGLILTMMVNVPMNEALAQVTIPDDLQAAQDIWVAYSSLWQVWNITRTVFSGAALLLTGYGLMHVHRPAG